MHADGTDLTQLTTYNYNADPVMAPDGRRIAYRSVPGGIVNSPDVDSRIYEGKYNIWVISVDGAQAWQLTDSEVVRGLPTWSPDSQRVAFSEGEGENSILVEIEVDSRARREMVTGASMPRYRPGGNGIGYVTPQGGLAWIDRDSAVHSIVAAETLPAETSVHDFDWMPDGEHVVYTLADETERMRPTTLGIRYSVWVARADGSDARQLAEALHDVQVSPDGQVIAAVKGSGFGDACIVDRQLAFLLPAPDLRSARTLGVTTFDGYPAIDQDHSFYLSGSVSWVSDRLVLARFLLTCAADYGIAGRYVVDPVGGEMMQVTGMEFLSGYE
jgi:Tol biopolymer transport system component